MYKAAMEYQFNEDCFEKACQLWRQIIYSKAIEHKGLIQMIFLANKPSALAIGVWTSQTEAMAFMETGVFKEFVATAQNMMAENPLPGKWKVLEAFTSD